MDVRHSGKLNIKMEQLNECNDYEPASESDYEWCGGCETGADCDLAHRSEDGRYHPECCTRAAQFEREVETGVRRATMSLYWGYRRRSEEEEHVWRNVVGELEDRVKEQQKQIEELQRELEQEKKRFPTVRISV